MVVHAWIAENRGKNGKGYELVLLNKSKNRVWLKSISKENVKELKNISVEIQEG